MTRPDRDVLVCRDCCCGSSQKHPATDHAAQRESLLDCARTAGVRVRVVECLDECDSSNVVLVRDFTRGRRPHDTWLGDVHDEDTTQRLVEWVRDGGPMPQQLDAHQIPRNRSGRLG